MTPIWIALAILALLYGSLALSILADKWWMKEQRRKGAEGENRES
jgi:hypothetical protein